LTTLPVLYLGTRSILFLLRIKLDKNNVSNQITIPKVIEKPLIFYQMYFFSLFLAIWTKFGVIPMYLK